MYNGNPVEKILTNEGKYTQPKEWAGPCGCVFHSNEFYPQDQGWYLHKKGKNCKHKEHHLDVSNDRKITPLHQQLKNLSKQKNGYYATKMLKEYEQIKKKYGVKEAEGQLRYNYSDFFGR